MLALKHYHFHSMQHLVVLNLNCNDHVCRPCYMDYMRNKNSSENVIRRWGKIRQDVYKQPQEDNHCVYCNITCDRCTGSWYGVEGIKVWKQFLSLTGQVDYAIGDVNINTSMFKRL